MNIRKLITLSSVLFVSPALAGTVGIYRIPENAIIAKNEKGQLFLQKEIFEKLSTSAKNGDTILIADSEWTLAQLRSVDKSFLLKNKVQHESEEFTLISEDQAQAE